MIRLHVVGDLPKKFETLNSALIYAACYRVTGYIVVDGEVINLRKGKRPGAGVKEGTWVPCA